MPGDSLLLSALQWFAFGHGVQPADRLWEKWELFLSSRAGRESYGKKGTVKNNNAQEIHKWKISWDLLFLMHITKEK